MGYLFIAFLFFLSIYWFYLLRKIVSRELQALSLLIFKTTKPGFIFYTLLVFPGVVVHELSHWLMAELLQVRTGKITLLPESYLPRQTNRLGSVKIAQTDPFRSLLIGFAPFFSGVGLLFVLIHLLSTISSFYPLGYLYLYLIWVVSNSMLLSKSDIRAWPIFVFFLILLFILKSYFHFSFKFLARIDFSRFILRPFGLTLGLGSAIALALMGLRLSLEKLLHRRIIFK